MAEQVLAAVRTGPGTTELREFRMPDIPDDGALLKVEVAGICGTDVKMYAKPPFADPVIMGHENVGRHREGRARVHRAQGPRRGRPDLRRALRRLLPLRVVPRGRVPALRGDRLAHQPRRPPLRLHLRGEPVPPVGRLLAVPLPAVERGHAPGAGRRRPPSSPAWSRRCPTASSGRWSPPGSATPPPCSSRARASRASPRSSPASRPAPRRSSSPAPPGTRPGWSWPRSWAPTTSSTCCTEDPLDRVLELTGGKGVDVVLDCTAGAGTAPVLLGIDALKRREGMMVVQGELAGLPRLPAEEAHREGDHDQERARPQLPRRRARPGPARLGPLPAGAAEHPHLRAGGRRPGDPRGRRRDRARTSCTSRCCPGGRRGMSGRGPYATRRAADRAAADGLAALGVRHRPRGAGPHRPARPGPAPDLPGRAHRGHGGHRQRAAGRQLDAPRRRRAVPGGRRPRGRADLAVRGRVLRRPAGDHGRRPRGARSGHRRRLPRRRRAAPRWASRCGRGTSARSAPSRRRSATSTSAVVCAGPAGRSRAT